MARRKIDPVQGLAALRETERSADSLAMAVRFCLEEITQRAPGRAVEIRVPPFGAAQCLGGANHRRGTPPNVFEISPEDFLNLCLGVVSFSELESAGKISTSGVLILELKQQFPLFN